MTLDDLVKEFWRGDRQDTKQRIAAVVEALRDELSGPEWGDTHLWFDNILTSDGEVVAGGRVKSEPGPVASLSQTPAADVCAWTQDGWEHRVAGCRGWSVHIYNEKYEPKRNRCHLCGKPIKFTEEKS